MASSSGGFSIFFIFSNLSSLLIYPLGSLQWSECQVLVNVGREYANIIYFTYKSWILKLFV
jgi:hypothetical protein